MKPENSHSLDTAIGLALDALPAVQVNERTGEARAYLRTKRRVVAWILEHYGGRWRSAAIEYRYDAVKKKQRHRDFDGLRSMKQGELNGRMNAVARKIQDAEHKATDPAAPREIRDYWKREAARLGGYKAMLEWEQSQREQREQTRFEQQGYSLVEQAEMLELAEQARPKATPRAAHAPPAQQSADAGRLIARLHARKASGG